MRRIYNSRDLPENKKEGGKRKKGGKAPGRREELGIHILG